MVEQLVSKVAAVEPNFVPADGLTSNQNSMVFTRVRRLSRQYSTEFTNGRITFVGTKGSDKNKITLIMAWHNSVSWCSRIAIILTFLSFVLNTIAFVTPYWMLVEDALGTSYSGLWTVCIFEVCGDFLHHQMFLWFHVVQGMMCLSLLSQLLSLICVFAYVASTLPHKKKLLITGSFGLTILAVMTSFVGVTVYGLKQGQRGFDTLSWSFVVASVASSVMVLAILPLALETKRNYNKQQDQVPILPNLESSKAISRPVLHHSPSVDSCVALRTEESLSDRQIKLTRPRSASQVRMRVNSVSQDCPPTPMHGEIEEECGAVFDFDNESFAP